jgi:3-methylcrotonyl-CoA carboxylase alpha subunit
MIAKLIVRGPTRHAALQKLSAALESYEIAGPVTNIEFLKRICKSQDFASGDVETGYIEKHHQELFARETIPSEAYAQAALGTLLEEMLTRPSAARSSPLGTITGFGTGFQDRKINLVEIPVDGKPPPHPTAVAVRHTGPSTFEITVDDVTYPNVSAQLDLKSKTLTSFFPHTRLDTTYVRSDTSLTLFQRGHQYRLQLAVPQWAEKALGLKDATNSVIAPMPCKVLRVEVQKGDSVRQDQPLVVIESMKMETVIRSPLDGVIKRVVHQKGVSPAYSLQSRPKLVTGHGV